MSFAGLRGSFWKKKGGVVGNGFLDAYPDAYRAFSTKLIYSSYLGPLLRIKYSLNPSLDLYPDENGNIDPQDIIDYAILYSTSIVIIEVFYDQTGNGRHWVNTGSNGIRVYNSGILTFDNRIKLSYTGSGQWLGYTPTVYPNNINLFYISLLNPAQTSLSTMLGSSSTSPAQSHSLVSTQGSGTTIYHRNAGPPSVYKNGILQSISNRGNVYTLLSSPGVVCEKNLDISNLWSPNDIQIFQSPSAGGASGQSMVDWIEFHENMDVSKLEGISTAINNSFDTPLY